MSTMMVHNTCLNVSVIIISFLSHSLNIKYITKNEYIYIYIYIYISVSDMLKLMSLIFS